MYQCVIPIENIVKTWMDLLGDRGEIIRHILPPTIFFLPNKKAGYNSEPHFKADAYKIHCDKEDYMNSHEFMIMSDFELSSPEDLASFAQGFTGLEYYYKVDREHRIELLKYINSTCGINGVLFAPTAYRNLSKMYLSDYEIYEQMGVQKYWPEFMQMIPSERIDELKRMFSIVEIAKRRQAINVDNQRKGEKAIDVLGEHIPEQRLKHLTLYRFTDIAAHYGMPFQATMFGEKVHFQFGICRATRRIKIMFKSLNDQTIAQNAELFEDFDYVNGKLKRLRSQYLNGVHNPIKEALQYNKVVIE